MKNFVQRILLSHVFIVLAYGYAENSSAIVTLAACLFATYIMILIEAPADESSCVDDSRDIEPFNIETQSFSDSWKWGIKEKVSTFIYRRYKCNTSFADEREQVKKSKILSKSKHLNSGFYNPRSSIPENRRRAIKESVASLSQS
jgi:hypothetical protein